MSRSANMTPTQFRSRVQPQLRILRERAISPEQKAQRLKAYHAIGSVVAEAIPGRATWGDKNVAELAKAIGYKESMLTKLRAFAINYSKRDLNRLCRLADRVTWSHVKLLLSIDDKGRRARKEEQIASKAWSTEDLRRAMKAEAAERHAGGRPFSRPADPLAGLRQLIAESERWLRLCEDVWAAEDDSLIAKLESLSKSRRTSKLQRQVTGAGETLNRIRLACGRLQRRLGEL